MPPKLKLVYFNIRGRGELIRLALHAGAVTFADERVAYEDWPQRRNEAPFGQLPYIDIDGKVYTEVLPIVRFVARKTALCGKTEEEQLKVEIILEQVHQFRDQLMRPSVDSLLSNGQRRFLEQKLQEEKIPNFLKRTNDALTGSKTGFFVGAELSVADLSVWDTVDHLVERKNDILSVYPNLLVHRTKIKSLPKLKKYLETRPPDAEVPKNTKERNAPPNAPSQNAPQNAPPQNVYGPPKPTSTVH